MLEVMLSKELTLESLAVELGVKRYQDNKLKLQANNDSAELAPQQKLIQKSIAPVSLAIKNFVTEVLGGKAKRKAPAAYALDGLNPDAVAYITAKMIFNGVGARFKTQKITRTIISAIELQRYMEAFEAQHPAMYKTLDRNIVREGSHKLTVMRRYANKLGVEFEGMQDDLKIVVGEFLIETFIRETGLVEKHLVWSTNKSIEYIRATTETLEWVEAMHGKFELLTPVNLPMVVKPQPWTTINDGGYISRPSQLVRTYNKGYLEELKHMDMPVVYRAINAVQDTAWRINTRIFEVMNEAWTRGDGRGGLPMPEGKQLNPEPAEDMESYKALYPEEFKKWKQERSRIYASNARAMSKVSAMGGKLYVAEMMQEFDAIYFPHNMDWRGRIYPLVPYLNPQGDDTSKALLQFSKGIPLTERGVHWLAIHLANTFGVDKVSFDDRKKWVEEHAAQISLCALDPLTWRFWEDADKPFCFLAACFEWENYMANGLGTMTYLPIALDGSNNGLQHLAAMRKDAVGGSVVNLVPHDKPADSYSEVAKVVEKKMSLRESVHDIFWRGKIDRGLCKRNVMTLCYGATKRGMLDQNRDELQKRQDDGKALLDMDDKESFEYIQHLSKTIYESIGEVVVAAREIMDWLQETAKIAASNNLPIHWVTPSGFHVLQAYKKIEKHRIHTTIGSIEIDKQLHRDTKDIDSRRQALGISPNFVHSMDSSHLFLTVNELATDYGMDSFAFIHDSYGTHAGEATDRLARVLREQFITMYQADVLADFVKQLKAQLPEELFTTLPALPSVGTLDLEGVLDSKYFFA